METRVPPAMPQEIADGLQTIEMGGGLLKVLGSEKIEESDVWFRSNSL